MRTEWEKHQAWAKRFIKKVNEDREAQKTMNKIITAIKAINFRDLATRAAWTFFQAFLAVILLSSEQLIELAFNGNWEALKALAIATVVGGAAAGLSALKTAILSIVREFKAL